jgi:glycerol-3-phosphate acyltransferase PlsY
MVSAVSLVLWSWLLGYPWPVTVFAAVAAVGVIGLHRANVKRLLRGEENRSTLWRRWWRKRASPSASL